MEANEVPVLTNTGITIFTSCIKGQGSEPNYLQWGSGNSPASELDTSLESPIGLPVLATTSIETTAITNDTYRIVGALTASSDISVSELGIFDADNNLFARVVFDSPINLNINDAVEFTIDIQITRG